MRIALISPPWPLFNRPSLQLATLKAFLAKNQPDLQITCHHPYLTLAAKLGFEAYHAISESSWASEAVCAPLLFHDKEKECNAMFTSAVTKNARQGKGLSARAVRRHTKETLETFINSLQLTDLIMVGITVSINQLTAALFLARLIKARRHDLPVVLGGASLSGEAGAWVFDAFKEIDYLVDGEGELPLMGLVDFLRGTRPQPPPSVRFRGCVEIQRKEQLDSIEHIPAPDFRDYFQELAGLPAKQRFFPVLPIEASRGCWWGRCNFCNLNLQWQGYRAKSVARMSKELNWLSSTYGALDFAFMDNALPRREASIFFQEFSTHGRDYTFFAELRVGHSREELAVMAKGGLHEVQIGIEALSSSLLKRLRKGASLMQNVAAMRHTEEFGMELSGNLILHFPGSTIEEVNETLNVLEFVWPFRPLKAVSFWLGMNSPVAVHSELFNIKNLKPHDNWYHLFPQKLLRQATPLILKYTGDRVHQKKLWKPVEQRIRLWNEQRKKTGRLKPLTYRDGGNFLHIRQETPSGEILTHRLNGLSRDIYLFCVEPVSLKAVFDRFHQKTFQEIHTFIDDLVKKRLMFLHEGQVLSLAIREIKAC
ncbi:MAG: RiPP maturation radical SAM C-methyltransferase [Dissulfuribacterales bacterium]